MSRSSFTQNASTLGFRGGGIYHYFGRLDVSDSTFDENGGRGIAVAPHNSITLNVGNSTVSNNESGGIFCDLETGIFPRINLTNCTVAGNRFSAGTQGGNGYGIYIGRGTLNVTNSTIRANEGGGIIASGAANQGTLTVKSSIVAQHFSDVQGNFTSGGFNLLGHASFSTGFAHGVNNDQVGTQAAPLDPKFDSAGLRNNGGPTFTLALQADSPAIDQGTAAGLTGTLATDGRGAGFARVVDVAGVAPPSGGDNADVGAFEFGNPIPTPTPVPTATPTATPTPRAATAGHAYSSANGDAGAQSVRQYLDAAAGGKRRQRFDRRVHRHRPMQKRIIVRAIGPSLQLEDKLANPLLELYDGNAQLIEANDNWQEAPNAQEIIDSTIPPPNEFEAAILRNVDLGAYTAIVRDAAGGEGVGLVEAYDLGDVQDSKLANIATRGRVLTGNNVMIGGLIITGSSLRSDHPGYWPLVRRRRSAGGSTARALQR